MVELALLPIKWHFADIILSPQVDTVTWPTFMHTMAAVDAWYYLLRYRATAIDGI